MENETSSDFLSPPIAGLGRAGAERQGVWQYIGWLVIGVAFSLLGLLLATYRYLREQQIRLHMKRRKKDAVIRTPRTAKEERAVAAVRREPVPATCFLSLHSNKNLDHRLNTEFKAVSKNQEDHPTSAAMRNVLNNIKQDIIPYDHSRVKLTDCPLPDTTNDYINASYIDLQPQQVDCTDHS